MIIKQRYYDGVDKVSTLLARRRCHKQAQSHISRIYTEGSGWTTRKPDKQETFQAYFQYLYTSGGENEAAIDSFLRDCPWKPINAHSAHDLEEPFSIDNLRRALRELPKGKSPGPDGLMFAFYMVFFPQLQDHLLELCNSFTHITDLTLTMSNEEIMFTPKLGKDQTLCSSYRPIALLKTDAKIYTKMLANYLETLLPGLVDPELV